MKLLLTAALLVLLPNQVAARAPSAGADAGDKLTCKYRARTGTRFATKICRTVAQWDAIAEANRIAFAEQQNRPNPNIGCFGSNPGASPSSVAVSGGCSAGM